MNFVKREVACKLYRIEIRVSGLIYNINDNLCIVNTINNDPILNIK